MTEDNDNSAVGSEGSSYEVVTVDSLLDRLRSSEVTEESGDSEPSLADQWYSISISDARIGDVVSELREIKYMLRDEFGAHDFLTTRFEDYTVSEGLLLCLFLSLVVGQCIKMLKGGFSWLLW